MLIDMYSLVETVIGSALLIWGIAVLVNKHVINVYMETFTNVEENEILIYFIASLFLILGLITVWVHNDWYLDTTILVTLIGWCLTLKSSLWLLFPKYFSKMTKQCSVFTSHSLFRWSYGIFVIIIGLLILYKYYRENFVM